MKNKGTTSDWFKDWFNSPYYHILYQHRDNEEAEAFLKRLMEFVHLNPNSKILDLACGKGRHSIILNQLGYNVTGIDLSAKSIEHAQSFLTKGLKFQIHDMRDLLGTALFDLVVNLFTSFGYFDREAENLRVIRNVSLSLRPGGLFLLDFMNTIKLRSHLISSYHEYESGKVKFKIHKEIKNGRVLKVIEVDDEGNHFRFEEDVMLITPDQFRDYFKQSGFVIQKEFGDYNLNPFEENASERFIILAQKP
jgi:SAM-dependent methyltransferase